MSEIENEKQVVVSIPLAINVEWEQVDELTITASVPLAVQVSVEESS